MHLARGVPTGVLDLRLSAREIGEVLEGDDSMRRAIGGDAVRDARMTRGGGIGYGRA